MKSSPMKSLPMKSLLNIKRGNPLLANMNSILHNVYILYFIFAIALMNLYYLVSSANYVYSAIFILVGFLTSFFSKNMIVILCIAMAATNILRFGKSAATEGFADKADDQSADDQAPDDQAADEDTDDADKKKGASTDDADAMTGITNDYKELQKLQAEIMGGMEKIADPLEKAENILDKMAKQLNVKV